MSNKYYNKSQIEIYFKQAKMNKDVSTIQLKTLDKVGFYNCLIKLSDILLEKLTDDTDFIAVSSSLNTALQPYLGKHIESDGEYLNTLMTLHHCGVINETIDYYITLDRDYPPWALIVRNGLAEYIEIVGLTTKHVQISEYCSIAVACDIDYVDK